MPQFLSDFGRAVEVDEHKNPVFLRRLFVFSHGIADEDTMTQPVARGPKEIDPYTEQHEENIKRNEYARLQECANFQKS